MKIEDDEKMDRLERMINNFFDNSINKNKHPKYGNIFSRHRRGRGRGLTEPYLLKCIRKTKKRGISGCFFNEEKNFYQFYSYHDSYYRNQANKAIRRIDNNEIINNGSMYRKIYPYECMCW